jgi:hypothetical protein
MKVAIADNSVVLVKFAKVSKKSSKLDIPMTGSGRLGVIVDASDESTVGKLVVFKDMDWQGLNISTIGDLVVVNKNKVFAYCELEEDDVVEIEGDKLAEGKKFNPYGLDAEWNGYLREARTRTSFLIDLEAARKRG